MIFENRFTKKGKCNVCKKIKMVTQECEECYFSGFDIDKQIQHLEEMKKEQEKKE